MSDPITLTCATYEVCIRAYDDDQVFRRLYHDPHCQWQPINRWEFTTAAHEGMLEYYPQDHIEYCEFSSRRVSI